MSERKWRCLLIYCTAASENRAKYCGEIHALAFAGLSSGQSLCEQNLLIYFSCQATDCVLKTFFFFCFKDISLHIDLCCDDILCPSKCHASELYEI